MKSTKKEPRAYRTPQVMDYGNIKQITNTVGTVGAGDGGGLGMTKTA